MTDDSILKPDKAKAILTNQLMDMLENDLDNLGAYFDHVGFDLSAISNPKTDLVPAWLGHYRIRQGSYDIDRAALDLATYPPVARRVFELMAENQKVAK